MKKSEGLKTVYLKLAAAITALVIAVTVTITLSYAWSMLSTAPAVKGAQIVVSGGSTILVAPDVVSQDGYHYPGEFSTSLRLTGDSYAYISSVAGLTPVSTADGENWVVQNGSGFTLDNTLEFANRTDGKGGYFYIDFWVVAPGHDYYLRVATDSGSSTRGGAGTADGSSLLGLPVSDEEGGDLILSFTDDTVQRAARVGFLVNYGDAPDYSEELYAWSAGRDGRFSELRGLYASPGSSQTDYSASDVFTVWEPDGLKHNDPSLDGSYLLTSPLGPDGAGGLEDKTIPSGRLAVQTGSEWKTSETSGSKLLDERFRGWAHGRSGINVLNAADTFFETEGNGWLFTQFISSGSFIKSTGDLLSAASGGEVSSGIVSALPKAGATEDVRICKLDGNIPQRIRMFVWIEGADADCVPSLMSSGRFVLNIQFAGADE